MKRDKNKSTPLPRAAGSALDDGVGSKASSSDLLKHAACSVHDKHQRRDLSHTEQSGKRNLGERCTIFTHLIKILFD